MTTRVTSPVFVGREEALATLDLVLSDAAKGRPSGASIAGEAGVGKSRLLDQLAVRAAERGVRVLAGHCFEVGEGERVLHRGATRGLGRGGPPARFAARRA